MTRSRGKKYPAQGGVNREEMREGRSVSSSGDIVTTVRDFRVLAVVIPEESGQNRAEPAGPHDPLIRLLPCSTAHRFVGTPTK